MKTSEIIGDAPADRTAPGHGFTAHVVAEAARIGPERLTANVLARTKQAVLDWLGVSISGAQQDSARATQAFLASEGGPGAARVIGTAQRATARQAALAVGIAGHSQDYDDMGVGGHPSVVVLPAVFAVAQEVGASGLATIIALLRGYEAMGMVSAACTNASYARGYHCTGTFGAFGATVGAGTLLDLDPLTMQRAMGIAGSQASGLKANFGTMSKHLNAGHAAAVGVLSARMAQHGFTGATDVIESPQGFAITHNPAPDDFDPAAPFASLGERLAVERIMFKQHAACGGTHSAINGINLIRARRPFTLADVADVELVVSEQAMTVCAIPEPRTGVEGMFSLRHAAALALTGTSTGPSGFTDACVNDPLLLAARDKVRVTPMPGGNAGTPTEVRLRFTDGQVLTERNELLVVTPDDRLDEQWHALVAKFHDIVAPILGAERSRELVGLVERLETLASIAELTERTAP
ncbi:MmgE/PrpD family protein [Novosphingobium bradum]|uniref:MmgE/PrpD family protein n=1 Tax=Novosphingobium bradum TaxID=1737444 RepID=A0ABV7IU62_9SPHN